jgi:hypothetical protein
VISVHDFASADVEPHAQYGRLPARLSAC